MLGMGRPARFAVNTAPVTRLADPSHSSSSNENRRIPDRHRTWFV